MKPNSQHGLKWKGPQGHLASCSWCFGAGICTCGWIAYCNRRKADAPTVASTGTPECICPDGSFDPNCPHLKSAPAPSEPGADQFKKFGGEPAGYKTVWQVAYAAGLAESEKRIQRLREALEKIGNLIGAPTMQYSENHERKELLSRLPKVSEIVQAALKNDSK